MDFEEVLSLLYRLNNLGYLAPRVDFGLEAETKSVIMKISGFSGGLLFTASAAVAEEVARQHRYSWWVEHLFSDLLRKLQEERERVGQGDTATAK